MTKNELIIYEGALCCSTGICGPEPDKELMKFNEAIKTLQSHYNGQLNVVRASLTFNAFMFFANKEILQLVKENGQEVLPITTMNGEIIAKQKYMKYEELEEILNEKIKCN